MNLWESYQQKIDWRKFETYKVRLRIADLVGGLPKDPEMIQAWVEASNKNKTAEEKKKIADAHLDELEEIGEEVAEKKGIGFARVNGGGLAIEGRQVKAALKEAANIIRNSLPTSCGKDGKIAALKSKVAEQLFVAENYIPLGKQKPDEVLEKPISVMTRQGPRTSIKRYELCRDCEITFTLQRLARGGEVTEAVMLAILDYAQQMGLGADRSQGRGRFTVLGVEKVDK